MLNFSGKNFDAGTPGPGLQRLIAELGHSLLHRAARLGPTQQHQGAGRRIEDPGLRGRARAFLHGRECGLKMPAGRFGVTRALGNHARGDVGTRHLIQMIFVGPIQREEGLRRRDRPLGDLAAPGSPAASLSCASSRETRASAEVIARFDVPLFASFSSAARPSRRRRPATAASPCARNRRACLSRAVSAETCQSRWWHPARSGPRKFPSPAAAAPTPPPAAPRSPGCRTASPARWRAAASSGPKAHRL